MLANSVTLGSCGLKIRCKLCSTFFIGNQFVRPRDVYPIMTVIVAINLLQYMCTETKCLSVKQAQSLSLMSEKPPTLYGDRTLTFRQTGECVEEPSCVLSDYLIFTFKQSHHTAL